MTGDLQISFKIIDIERAFCTPPCVRKFYIRIVSPTQTLQYLLYSTSDFQSVQGMLSHLYAQMGKIQSIGLYSNTHVSTNLLKVDFPSL